MLILHLSDIHFRKSEIETEQDPNAHLRNELVLDIKAQCERLGPPDAVVVSGDIAFAGHVDEFVYATNWLKEICTSVGGDPKTVFVCPGNHDVVRSVADGTLVQLIHDDIKNRSGSDLGTTIHKHLVEEASARLLYAGLENYNGFALQFFCDLLPPNRTKARRDLKLNDGSTLRLWGLNTAFVSSSKDAEGSVFVDPASLQILRESGVVNVVIAHHHLSWLRQKGELEDHLNDVAKVQIFGHIHTNRIAMNRDYIRLTASAAHPDRHEADWEPGYNLIELEVEGSGDARRLCVRTHVRVWQKSPGVFRPKMDGQRDVFEHHIKLETWLPPAGAAAVSTNDIAMSDAVDETPPDAGPEMNTLREVGLRFYQLTFSQKSAIAGKLDLLEDEDMTQPDYERFRRVFIRANERGQLKELEGEINAVESEG